MEVLTAFVRKQVKVSPKTTEKATEKQTASTQTSTDNELIPPPPTDIQAVLTVIGRRQLSDEHGENYNRLNLINTNLRHVRLSNANLQGALLFNANLQGAVLYKTSLQGAYLNGANLQGAHYTDNSTSPEICNRYFYNNKCPTTFPTNFDPKAAGMVLVK